MCVKLQSLDGSVRTDVAPAENWPSRSECARREKSSAPRVRHGFLQPSPLTLTSFMETFAVAATRARLRNGPARIEEIPQDCTRDASEFNGTRKADEAFWFIWHRRRTIPWNSPSRPFPGCCLRGFLQWWNSFTSTTCRKHRETQSGAIRWPHDQHLASTHNTRTHTQNFKGLFENRLRLGLRVEDRIGVRLALFSCDGSGEGRGREWSLSVPTKMKIQY